MISGVELPTNNAAESAEETEEKVRRIIEVNIDIRLWLWVRQSADSPLIKSNQTKEKQHPSLRISYVNLEHTISENIFSQKWKISLISLIKKLISTLASQNIDRLICIKPTLMYQRTLMGK